MAIKATGTGFEGSIKMMAAASGSIRMVNNGGGGGGGGGGGEVSWTSPGPFGGSVTVAVGAGDTVQFANMTAASNSLTSTYASQAYTISTSDSSFNAVSQISSGDVPLDLGTVNFAGSFGSTYSVADPMMPGLTVYYFIAVVSGVSFKLAVGVISGGGGVPGGGGPRPPM